MRATPLNLVVAQEGKSPMQTAIEGPGLGHLNRQYSGFLGDIVPGCPGTQGQVPPGWQPHRYQSNTYDHYGFYRPGYDGHPSTQLRRISAQKYGATGQKEWGNPPSEFHDPQKFSKKYGVETFSRTNPARNFAVPWRAHWYDNEPWTAPQYRLPHNQYHSSHGPMCGHCSRNFLVKYQNVIVVAIITLLILNLFLLSERG